VDFRPIAENLPLLAKGLAVTLTASFFGGALALMIGLLLGIISQFRQPVLNAIVRSYVYFFRGTPLLVLLFLSFFGLPVVGVSLPALVAGIIAIGFNSGGYLTEAVRSALESIDVSQKEAAAIDGMGTWMTLTRIIFPQASRQMVAPVINEIVSLIKGTSLLAVISVGDVTRAAQLIVGQAFIPFEAYITLAVIYLVVASIITRGSIVFERRLDRVLWSSDGSTHSTVDSRDLVQPGTAERSSA
jgi:His/Glu/Gln/Arg/opine family amino acid ABC transporter permease subunit